MTAMMRNARGFSLLELRIDQRKWRRTLRSTKTFTVGLLRTIRTLWTRWLIRARSIYWTRQKIDVRCTRLRMWRTSKGVNSVSSWSSRWKSCQPGRFIWTDFRRSSVCRRTSGTSARKSNLSLRRNVKRLLRLRMKWSASGPNIDVKVLRSFMRMPPSLIMISLSWCNKGSINSISHVPNIS